MRSLQLESALTDFVTQAGAHLHAEVLAGHEVPFELDSHSAGRRGSSPLYCYRPLTGTFVAERLPDLRRLPAYSPAAAMLERFDSLDRYLISAGEDPNRRGGRTRGDLALLVLLKEVFDEQTDFEPRPERLQAALERLDGSALAAAGETMLVATLHGLTISSPELALTRGLVLAQPDAWQGLPPQALAGVEAGRGHLLAIFTTSDSEPGAGLAQGRTVMLELLRALRLFGDGRVTLGALAWNRIGSGPWQTIALGQGGRPHGMLVVCVEQEDELRAFCNLVSRRAPEGDEIAWALRRFELGCGRGAEYEALSDHLMALRALLEPEGPSTGLLAGRVAALCATPEQRMTCTERVLAACALERETIAGGAIEHAGGLELAREIANHLRALLRDLICGHLPRELVSLADRLLLEGSEADSFENAPSEVGASENVAPEVALSENVAPKVALSENVAPEVASSESPSDAAGLDSPGTAPSLFDDLLAEQVPGDPEQAGEVLDVTV